MESNHDTSINACENIPVFGWNAYMIAFSKQVYKQNLSKYTQIQAWKFPLLHENKKITIQNQCSFFVMKFHYSAKNKIAKNLEKMYYQSANYGL